MKTRKWKAAFFIVAGIILIIGYLAFFGLSFHFGEYNQYVFKLPGAADMRFGIDIRGGVDAVFEPADENAKPTADQLAAARETINPGTKSTRPEPTRFREHC